MNYPKPRCGCGRYVSYDADNYTPFGNSYDLEPPESVFMCPKCAAKAVEFYREWDSLPCHWIPAKWEFELAIELRRWRAGPKRAAWSEWRKIDKPLPDGYEWRTYTGWEEHTPKGD